jgi:hypothetical protein
VRVPETQQTHCAAGKTGSVRGGCSESRCSAVAFRLFVRIGFLDVAKAACYRRVGPRWPEAVLSSATSGRLAVHRLLRTRIPFTFTRHFSTGDVLS